MGEAGQPILGSLIVHRLRLLTIESADSICRDSGDTQYMTRLKNIKNVTRTANSRTAKSRETRLG